MNQSDLELGIIREVDSPIFTIKWDLPLDNTHKFSNPVPVCSDEYESGTKFWRLLGFARVFEEDHFLVAEVFLDYATPERLDLENGINYQLLPETSGKDIQRLFMSKAR